MKVLAKIARFLEKLLKVRFAVEDTVHGGIVAHLSKHIFIKEVSFTNLKLNW